MTDDTTIREVSAATVRFEQELESLLLEAFAKGAAVEGTREITLPVDGAPNWRVAISKVRADDSPLPDYDL